MLRIPLAAAALALCLAVPAFAQGTMSGPPSQAGAMQSGNMSSNNMSSMTCDQMMAKAKSMTTHGTAGQMTMMQNQMSMARQAEAKSDEAGCKMHAQKAMDVIK